MKKILLSIFSVFILLAPFKALASEIIADDASSLPIVGENFYLSESGSVPYLIENDNGLVEKPFSQNSVLYIEIVGATLSYELSGFRSFIEWDELLDAPIYPSIEYIEVFDEDKITSLGYKFVVAFKFIELEITDSYATYKGEITVGKRVIQDIHYQPFEITVLNSNISTSTQLYVYDQHSPIFKASEHTGEVGMQFGSSLSLYFMCNDMWDVDLSFLTTPNSLVIFTNPDIEMNFFNFRSKPVFNEKVTLIIPASSGEFIYQIIGDDIILLKTQYDKDRDAYVYETYALGSYVATDEMLSVTNLSHLKKNPQTSAYA